MLSPYQYPPIDQEYVVYNIGFWDWFFNPLGTQPGTEETKKNDENPTPTPKSGVTPPQMQNEDQAGDVYVILFIGLLMAFFAARYI